MLGLSHVAPCGTMQQTERVTATLPATKKPSPKRVTWAAPPADLLAVAFVTDAQAAAYLGLSIRSARYLAE